MTPKDYLRQYTESFKPPETESSLPADGSDLMLERGYYYPPNLQLDTYLDTLSRADLLEIAQQLLATEYPAQRLIRRQVGEYLETVQRLRNEREQLNADLGAERKRLETLVLDAHAELENHQSQIINLENERTLLLASTSWKVTALLRRVSQAVKGLCSPRD